MTKLNQERIERKLKTLTVKELIEHLQSYPDNAPVVFASDYGDHSHTVQISGISLVDDLSESGEEVCESAYSDSGLALTDKDYDSDEEDEDVDLVVLRRR